MPIPLRPFVILLVAVVAACTPVREATRCHRVEADSMGPENGFRTHVADPGTIHAADERIDLTITALPSWTGPLTLVQTVEGRETARWSVTMPASPGSVHRCTIATSMDASTCKITTRAPALPVAGDWSVDASGGRVLEAAVSFRLCD